MKAKEIEALESYIKTDNEHWNEHALKMLCELLQQAQFENLETPLHLFNISTDIFCEHSESPFKAVQIFAGEMDKQKLTPLQKLFIYECVCRYLKQSEFDFDLTPIKVLLNSQKEKLKAESQPVKPLTKNLREMLKDMMQKELETLPDTLKGLEPVQRLNILCKLMPFVLPKVISVTPEQGEPDEFKIREFHL